MKPPVQRTSRPAFHSNGGEWGDTALLVSEKMPEVSVEEHVFL